ncbi:MAG: DUF488 family protein [Acidimicrobiales bacterium]
MNAAMESAGLETAKGMSAASLGTVDGPPRAGGAPAERGRTGGRPAFLQDDGPGRPGAVAPPPLHLITVGHGTESSEGLASLLRQAGVEDLVDVRTAPGSRRYPHFGRKEMEIWVPGAGVSYRWEPDLGGFRRPSPGSPNVALRHPSFRGYADYMMTERFAGALARVLDEAADKTTAVMCSETLWWRCHRRLIADVAMLVHGAEVTHLDHAGHLSPHRPTAGARLGPGSGQLVYDAPVEEPSAAQLVAEEKIGAPPAGT